MADAVKGTFAVKVGLAQMLKGGVIMDVVNVVSVCPRHVAIVHRSSDSPTAIMENITHAAIFQLSDLGLATRTVEARLSLGLRLTHGRMNG